MLITGENISFCLKLRIYLFFKEVDNVDNVDNGREYFVLFKIMNIYLFFKVDNVDNGRIYIYFLS